MVMKIRTGFLRRYAVIALAVQSCFLAQAELKTINTITNDANAIGLYFDPPLTLPDATNAANYSVYVKTGQVSVASVAIQTNNQYVTLTLATNITEPNDWHDWRPQPNGTCLYGAPGYL